MLIYIVDFTCRLLFILNKSKKISSYEYKINPIIFLGIEIIFLITRQIK